MIITERGRGSTQKNFTTPKLVGGKTSALARNEQVKGKLNVLKHVGDGDMEVIQKVDEMLKEVREQEDNLEEVESLSQPSLRRSA